jgi:hypothetical protein
MGTNGADMTHNAHVAEGTRASWQRWLLTLLAMSTLVFGFFGQWRYERMEHPDRAPDAIALAYHTLQLFIVHGPHLEGDIPWQLHVGRLSGAALVFAAGLVAVLLFFRQESLGIRLRMPWHKDHVVICGLGDLGMRLALDGRRRGKFVVAIEQNAESANVDLARATGIFVLQGDAQDARLLQRARVDRAALVIASCRADTTNVAVAAKIGQVLPATRRRAPPVCRVLFRDPKLSDLFADASLFPAGQADSPRDAGNEYRVKFRNLDLHDTAARQALRKYPLDFQPIRKDDDLTVRLVVAGFGAMGRCLVRHAARIGHFANESTHHRPLKITIIDRNVQSKLSAFKAQYQHFDKICDVHYHDADPEGDGFIHELDLLSRDDVGKKKELTTYVVCLEHNEQSADSENLRIGVPLSRLTKERPAQTLIYLSSRNGFGTLFSDGARGAGLSSRLHAFGMLEDIYTWETLLDESEDSVARVLHEKYRSDQQKHGATDDANPDWDRLPENLRDSNRQAADHIPVKLRALGYHDEPLQPNKESIQRFTDEGVFLLSQMEHARWCAERWLDGWDYALATDRSKKLNKNLRPWDKLDLSERNKDPEQVHTIVHALRMIGLGIYR